MTSDLQLELIKCLIEQPGVNVNAKGINGKTLLHYAIELDELSLVELLLTQKSVNPFVEDHKGKNSLDYVRSKEKSEILEALINNKYGAEQDSLLHLAVMLGKVDAVRYLINKGIDVNVQNALLHTPLHLAAGCGNAEIVEVLVKEGNAELDIYDARNQTPMHYAVNNKKLKVVKLLIDFGANVNSVSKNKHSTQLSSVHVAVSSSNYDERDLCLDILRCLINAPNSEINIKDYENKTPLHYADRLKTIEILLSRKDIDPLIKDDSGKTAFCYAREENKKEIVKVLVRSRYGGEKNSLLHLAARKGYVEFIDVTLEEGIDVDSINESGETAIYLAAENQHFNVVKLLLNRGADITDVFQYAIRENDKNLIKLLLKEKNIVLFGRQDSFPTFHMLSNKYLQQRNIADEKIKKYNNIINISVAICVIALVATYPDIGIAVMAGIFALMVGVVMSNCTQKYIEEELQKKMSIEFENSENGSKGIVSEFISDIEVQSTSSEESCSHDI